MKSLGSVHRKQVLGTRIAKYHIAAENKKLVTRFLYVCIAILILVLVSSFFVWKLEYQGSQSSTIRTFGDSIWWAIVTITTVGYGDKVPATQLGRIIGFVLIGAGFSFLPIISGLVASMFVEDRMKGAKGLKQIKSHNHVVVCGWNKTGEALLKSLSEKGQSDAQICIISSATPDFFESLISQYSNLALSFVRGEATHEETLRRAAANNAAQVIILADQNLSSQNADDRSVIIANAVHYMAPKAKVTVQLLNSENRSMLQRLGIRDILVFDDIGGSMLANNVIDTNSLAIMGGLLNDHNNAFATHEIPEQFIGKAYESLFDYLYNDKNMLLLGLITKQADLSIDSIFGDNTSAIDQFIKNTLGESKRMHQEERDSIRINLSRDTIIKEDDYAIVLIQRNV